MTRTLVMSTLLACLLSGCVTTGAKYDDMTDNLKGGIETVPGKVYRLWETGICGAVSDTDMTVTHIIPGSVADGKIQVGDILCGMQHRGMWARGGSVSKTARLRLFRIGRDWNWHFYVTVNRPSLRDGKGNTLVYDLHMPPIPGNTCHYGPTGFFAERHPDHLAVNVILKDSPSDGKLMKGDKILAVDGEAITGDAYNQFTLAVDRAESPAGKGLLKLRVRRTGEMPEGSTATEIPRKEGVLFVAKQVTNVVDTLQYEDLDVVLKLKTMGQISDTSPVACVKTDALITQTADYLANGAGGSKLSWELLGLLATGEEKYINVVRERLHDPKSWARPPEKPVELRKNAMYVSWRWGYQNLILCEYYLLTGDDYVLPAITQLSRTLAAGQDQAGLWGHQMATEARNGRAAGYGVMNQPSLAIFISLILAEKCGIKDPMVRRAIQRTHNHYDKWVGIGSLPYGNHGPNPKHFTNNGTSGSLAVAFALLGNNRGARFYGSMSAAATEEILLGHGGPVWNILWSGLGANILGPEMATAYNDRIHWLRTVTRTWNGRYLEMKGWGSAPGSGSWETGCYLMNLCASRRKIHITGKGMDRSLWVNAEEAKEIVEAGDLDTSSDEVLLSSLGDSLPPVRYRSAEALAMRDAHVSDEVMALLANGTRDQKVGAIHAIQRLKIESAVDELLATALDDKEDLWVRQLAIKTLAQMDGSKQHAPKLLELLVRDKPYDQPYGELDMDLGRTLVTLYEPDPYATDLDKAMFYKGVNTLLNHKHGSGRGSGMALLKNIPIEDLPRMVDQMVYLFEDKDKTYTFYPGSGRQDVLDIFYRHGIKESMDYTVETLKQGRGGQQRARMRLLKTFGGEAKYLIPRIKEQLGEKAEPIVKQIEDSTTTKPMIPLKEFTSKAE